MKPLIRLSPILLAALLPATAHADLFISNFTALNGTAGATGVWKNSTTGTDLSTAVTLSQTGGTVRQADGSDQESTIDDSFPWWDNIFVFPPTNFFEPNYDGDHINIEVAEATTAVVTIDFHAQVVDPVLNFTDIDTQTTMIFTDPFAIVGSSGNIVPSTTQVQTSGVDVGTPFDEECAGSLQFSGTFTSLTFSLVNAALAGSGDDDRTGFSVSTTTEPVPVAGTPGPVTISTPGSNVTLMWPASTFVGIDYWTSASGTWQNLSGADPTTTTMWTGPRSMFGDHALFRGVLP